MTNKEKVNSYIEELDYGINILNSITCTNTRLMVLKRMKDKLKLLNNLITTYPLHEESEHKTE